MFSIFPHRHDRETTFRRLLDEMRAARQEHARLKGNKGAGKRSLTEDDIRYNIEQQFALSQATLDIRQKYYAAYQQILAPSQIARLYELEKKGADRIHEMAKKKHKK